MGWDIYLEDNYSKPSPEEFGYVHKNDMPDIEHCKDMITGMIESMYQTGDVASLESCLDELVHQFNMKLPTGDPVIEHKSTTGSESGLSSWLRFNQQHNEQLRTQQNK